MLKVEVEEIKNQRTVLEVMNKNYKLVSYTKIEAKNTKIQYTILFPFMFVLECEILNFHATFSVSIFHQFPTSNRIILRQMYYIFKIW